MSPVILSQLIFSIIFAEKYTQIALGIISSQMAGEAVVTAKLLDMECDNKYIHELKNGMNLNVEIINDAKLQKTGISKDHKTYRILRRAIVKRGYWEYYIKTENDNMDVYIPSTNGRDVYKISFPRKTLYIKIIPIVLGGGLISSLILLAIAFIFMKNQIKPIKKLAQSASDFGRGLDTEWYIPEGATEVRIAGSAFCEMTKRVKELMNNRIITLAGISHDLRTPLTKIKLQLSLMEKTKETKLLLTDVNAMIKMVESFTLHASEQNKENFVMKNLLIFLKEIAKIYATDTFKIHVDGDKDIEISMKYMSMKRALGNIVANARKFAKHLYIRFQRRETEITIHFEDDGMGLKEANINSIFSPFVKQNTARTHSNDSTPGVGLGLSIARDVIIAHGGTITASNSQTHGGAHFVVTIPHDLGR
ncbi:MAG: hypothetical protein LBF56_00035 [Holosporales bacterium]|nr:hypothetical protein [Holosporales bacterium]